MLQKINQFLNILMGAFIGVFVGHGIYRYFDYKTHPDLYAIQSAPWYTSILVYGLITAGVIIIGMIAKWFIRKRL